VQHGSWQVDGEGPGRVRGVLRPAISLHVFRAEAAEAGFQVPYLEFLRFVCAGVDCRRGVTQIRVEPRERWLSMTTAGDSRITYLNFSVSWTLVLRWKEKLEEAWSLSAAATSSAPEAKRNAIRGQRGGHVLEHRTHPGSRPRGCARDRSASSALRTAQIVVASGVTMFCTARKVTYLLHAAQLADGRLRAEIILGRLAFTSRLPPALSTSTRASRTTNRMALLRAASNVVARSGVRLEVRVVARARGAGGRAHE
jgi:hypothetical protein